jgi:hypothetical protein
MMTEMDLSCFSDASGSSDRTRISLKCSVEKLVRVLDKIHRASEEQYNQDENIVAAQVWNNFCRIHWPDGFAQPAKEETKQTRYEPNTEYAALQEENWDVSATYVNSALL